MSPAPSGPTIGERIAMARKVAGFNQHTLAEILQSRSEFQVLRACPQIP